MGWIPPRGLCQQTAESTKRSHSTGSGGVYAPLPTCPPSSECSLEHAQGLHDVFTSEGTAHLQSPRGNLVRSISVAPAQAQALSLVGFAHQQIQHVLSNIQSHLVRTLAQWGIFSSIVTLKMPQDKEFTTFRVDRINNLYSRSKASYMKNDRNVRLISYYSGLISSFLLCWICLPFCCLH